jgi:hypothetical protein
MKENLNGRKGKIGISSKFQDITLRFGDCCIGACVVMKLRCNGRKLTPIK